MTQFNFSTLANGQVLAFDPLTDILRFDLAAYTAGALRIAASGSGLVLSMGAVSITLQDVAVTELSLTNVTFANGSRLVVGDGTAGTIADVYGQSYDLSTTGVGHFIDGGGGADLVLGGRGSDWIVGNVALTPLTHVSQSGGTGSPTSSTTPTISADGRFVGFFGGWTGFGSVNNSATDVFVRDMLTGAITNEHRDANGDPGLSGSGRPVISADGNWLAFWSASQLVAGNPLNGHIYVADTRSGAIEAVSLATGGAFSNGPNDYPDISADGRFVVFESRSSNLAAGGNISLEDVFLHDRATGTTTRLSTSQTGGDGNGVSSQAAVSANGRYVVFQSQATNLTTVETGGGRNDIYLFDRVTGALTNITGGRGGAFEALLADVAAGSAGGVAYGGVVVFQTGKQLVAGDTNNSTDIYAYDIVSGSFTRVSTAAGGGQANLGSDEAAISDDGRYVVFRSFATNLVAGDTNGVADIFVKDLLTGAIARVSVAPGVQGNFPSGRPQISAGGEWIVFESSATNLVASDANGGLTDVFRVSNPLLRDTLAGGLGNDTYVLGRPDVIIEAANAGVDTVRADFSYTLGANLENLVLTGTRNINGTGNAAANVITGNAGNNVINGAAGIDTASYATAVGPVNVSLAIAGLQVTGAGTDRLIGIENLTGSAFNDRLTGNAGDNRLDGGGGADTMTGGEGDDTYVANANTDTIVETGVGDIDTVFAAVNWTLSPTLENLTLTGTAVTGNGNTSANRLTGNALNNALGGFGGNDTLNGGAGNDTMNGGAGNDTYVTDAPGDIITGDTAGIDTVISGVNRTLQPLLENLTLTGTATIGNGNTVANEIVGNALTNTLGGQGGNDTITGGAGRDVMSGGAGGDRFVFRAQGESSLGAGRDLVTDFVLGVDVIDLSLIDARPGIAGNQAFAFTGSLAAAFSVWFVDIGTDIVLRADLNGNAVADMEIQIRSVNAMVLTSLDL